MPGEAKEPGGPPPDGGGLLPMSVGGEGGVGGDRSLPIPCHLYLPPPAPHSEVIPKYPKKS